MDTAITDNGTGDAGVEANSRLTALTGAVLFILLAVEGWTIPQVNQLLTLHVFIGVLLVGPVLLKIAATLYRFAKYYGGSQPYVRRGPPNIVLRVLGPLVILSSLAVLGTGIGLLAVSRRSGDWLLTLHQASFIVWVSVTSIHVLGHLRETAVSVAHEVRDPSEAGRRRRGQATRLLLVGVALVVGVGLALALTPADSSWAHGHNDRFHGAPPR